MSLPQLQNLMKRDPESYQEELEQQAGFFQAQLDVFRASPSDHSQPLAENVMFLAQVAKCYPDKLADFPQVLVGLLRDMSGVLEQDMRMTFCRALILMRHKGLLEPTDLMELFFGLLSCPDKTLRAYLREHIITDVKNVNAKKKNAQLNKRLQNFVFQALDKGDKITAKIALEVTAELYRKHIWRDARTVNAVAAACLSETTKIMVTSLNFFLGKDDDEDKKDGGDSDSEDELPTMKSATIANKVNKKSRKRQKFLENLKKAHKKKKKKEKVADFNFSALHLIHDPQKFAEELFKKLEKLKEKFEVKLLFLDLISRLIGTHELILLNYYPYIARFLQPHQREVVSMLQYSAQAAHELVPSDALEPVIR